MATDTSEDARRTLVDHINTAPATRNGLEQQYGQVWDTDELVRDFTVRAYLAPYALVRRRADGALGTLMFQHRPRFYFGWEAESGD